MQPVRLSEDQLNTIIAASTPLPPDLRSAFLETCAREIAALPMIGDGALHRVIMQVQRQYFDAPDLSDRHAPRWSSRRASGVRAAVDG